MPTQTVPDTITNPDQPTTTVLPATAIPPTALPSGIPARIVPPDQLNPDTDLTGYSFIGILFNLDLNWLFVVNNPVSSTQIFAYMPIIIATALGIPGSEVLPYALQVYIPTSYESPANASLLATMWLGYIPTPDVNTLAAEILAKQSKFYTGSSDPVAVALAEQVNSGFSIMSVSSPNTGNADNAGGTGTSSSNNASKTRQDAIIGVVSSLAGIAILVLVVLAYRMMKRRRELAHRRLSESPDMSVPGARPQGQDFDQDSVGGARRRSFYYAEDSLRGFQSERGDESVTTAGPSTVTQRRVIAPGTTISAPILQESSLNW